jgi:sortase (surface protein transpeptidase)
MYRSRLLAAIIVLYSTMFLSACGLGTAQAQTHYRAQLPEQRARTLAHEEARTDDPVRLIIPAINVNASIEQVSLLPSGNLDTPQQNPWTDTGWYKNGPKPGERGSAVIDGHLNRPGDTPAVFWYLNTLRPGDKIMVVTSSNRTLTFHVTESTYYSPQSAPLQNIFGDTSGNYLNLITCAGDWIPSEHQTTLRTVVYATLE